MVDPVETAHEQVHEAAHHEPHDPWPRAMAIVVSFLAASLALSEIGAKSSQTAYLTHHIGASDLWNFYQAKNIRAYVLRSEGEVLESLPSAESEPTQGRIKKTHDEETRLRDEPNGDGMKQLRAKAEFKEHERDHSFHRYHGYEYTSGALEIAIVLASVSVITKIRGVGYAAGVIGAFACAFGVSVATGIF